MICPGLQAGDYYALAFRPWLLKSWLLVTCHVEFRGLRTRQPCPYRQSDVPEHGRNACHVVDTAALSLPAIQCSRTPTRCLSRCGHGRPCPYQQSDVLEHRRNACHVADYRQSGARRDVACRVRRPTRQLIWKIHQPQSAECPANLHFYKFQV